MKANRAKNPSSGRPAGSLLQWIVLLGVLFSGAGILMWTSEDGQPADSTASGADTAESEYRSRSCPDCPEFLIDIRNLRSQPVDVFWVDFEGREIPYGTITPGETFSQPTSRMDVWVVRQNRLLLERIAYPPKPAAVHIR